MKKKPARTPKAAIPTRPSWWPHLWKLALLWAFVLAAYSNSFDAGFVYDFDRLVDNAHRIEMRGDSIRKNRGKPNT